MKIGDNLAELLLELLLFPQQPVTKRQMLLLAMCHLNAGPLRDPICLNAETHGHRAPIKAQMTEK